MPSTDTIKGKYSSMKHLQSLLEPLEVSESRKQPLLTFRGNVAFYKSSNVLVFT
eukprot:c30719_g1_i1 orf=66-227(+)